LVVWHSWHSSALKWRLFSRLSLKFSSSPFIGTGTNSKVWFLWYDRKHFWKARIWVLKYFNDFIYLVFGILEIQAWHLQMSSLLNILPEKAFLMSTCTKSTHFLRAL
jgi:hypothetical protein